MSPLASVTSTADVIVAKLAQPHRFDYVLQCKCGFQHFGFKGDIPADAVEGTPEYAQAALVNVQNASLSHLSTKHGVASADVPDHVTTFVGEVTGGESYDLLNQMVVDQRAAAKDALNTKLDSKIEDIQDPTATPPIHTPDKGKTGADKIGKADKAAGVMPSTGVGGGTGENVSSPLIGGPPPTLHSTPPGAAVPAPPAPALEPNAAEKTANSRENDAIKAKQNPPNVAQAPAGSAGISTADNPIAGVKKS